MSGSEKTHKPLLRRGRSAFNAVMEYQAALELNGAYVVGYAPLQDHTANRCPDIERVRSYFDGGHVCARIQYAKRHASLGNSCRGRQVDPAVG